MVFKAFFYLFLLKYASARLNWEVTNTAFDLQMYEDVLDDEECHRQVRFIRSIPIIALQFADAGIRFPRALLSGNNVDLGSYDQCLGINYNLMDMDIQGKYCTIEVPMNQTFHLPEFSDWSQLNVVKDDVEFMRKMALYERLRTQIQIIGGSLDGDALKTLPVGPLAGTVLRLAVCIPKPCTTQRAMTSFLFNLTAVGFKYEDDYCRLPNDKPWVTADYVAIVVFSFLGILTLLSTSYDLYSTFYVKIDRKQLNTIYSSFSVYTNGKRLMDFPAGPGSIQCLDGIRSLAMMWVILGHTFGTEKFTINVFDLINWLISLEALWIISATITVDTFFTITGVLLVYTSAGKMKQMDLLKNLHIFYLNRLMRMFPVLATAVLLQVSFFNRMLDGPAWTVVSSQTNTCRTYWWTTLLHIQNLLNPDALCISHSWYIAIDIQLYLLSPLILFWVLDGNKRKAWVALMLGLLIPLMAATIYNYINDFPAGTLVLSRASDLLGYMHNYYFFTLTRAPPFFVGMMIGYVLHLYRNQKVNMHWFFAVFMWVCAIGMTTTIFFSTYFIMQFDWDNRLVDNLMNSFMRPAWAAALCWIIFACEHGYGGPVNWLLSLDVWKLPSRLSYAMFVFHYPIMFAIFDTTTSPKYFSVARLTFLFFAHFMLTIIVAYFVTLLIDTPFSIIVKAVLKSKSGKSKTNPVLNGQQEDKEKAEARNDNEIVKQRNGLSYEDSYDVNEGQSRTNCDMITNGNGIDHVKFNEDSNHNSNQAVVDKMDGKESNKTCVLSKPNNGMEHFSAPVKNINNNADDIKKTD